MTKFAVLVSGGGTNLQAILDAIGCGKLSAEVSVVLSNNPNAFALERATKAGVPCVALSHKTYKDRADFDQAMVDALRSYAVDWIVLAGFMRLLTPVFLNAFEDRVVNLHPSLLPAFPGAHGIRDAMDYGVKVTGCTVHLVSEDTDAGPIIDQMPVPILDSDTAESLLARVHVEEHKLLVDVLQRAATGRLKIETSASGRKHVRTAPSPIER